MRAFLIASVILAGTAAEAQAPGTPFRIGLPGQETQACGAGAEALAPATLAYVDHLSARLSAPVQVCLFAESADAAKALAAGEVEMALLDGAGFAPVAGEVRAILGLLSDRGLNRIPVRVAVRSDSRARSLQDLKGGRLVFGGRLPAHLDAPRDALADYGAAPAFFGQATVAEDHEDAAARLRRGEADAMVLHIGAWQRLCRGDSPADTPCDDLRAVWTERPVADRALAVRRDMETATRHRLVGIHIAMHLEAPRAFAGAIWRAGASEFEPTEAEALILREEPVS